MDSDRDREINELETLLIDLAVEKRKIQMVLAYSMNDERRARANLDLWELLKAIKCAKDRLATLEAAA